MVHKCHACGSSKIRMDGYLDIYCYDCGVVLDGDPTELFEYIVKD